MTPGGKSQLKQQRKYKKGDVILSLKPWKLVPLFQEDTPGSILVQLPKFVQQDQSLDSLLPSSQNDSVMDLPGVSRLLKKSHHADADSLSIYTLITAITLVFQGATVDDLNRMHSLAPNGENGSSDDSEEMRLEAWTWIQDRISWKDFQQMYARIQNALCISSVPHPLEIYATQVVPSLSRNEVLAAVNLLGLQEIFFTSQIAENSDNQKKESTPETSESTMAMRLSQLLKDDYPPRNYGILFRCSLSSTPRALKSTATALSLAPASENGLVIRHGCLPDAALEITSLTNVNAISLYDTDITGDDEIIEICSVPLDGGVMEREAHRRCHCSNRIKSDEATRGCCILCHHKEMIPGCENNSEDYNVFDWKEIVKLGHHFFQQERFRDASDCYRKALELNENLDDIRHALGALQLAQGHFLEAQQMWKKAAAIMRTLGRSPEKHEGIHLQLQKQQAYHYLESPENSAILVPGKYKYQSYFNNQCFVTPMLEKATCQKLIQIATSNGKFTTGRHYAVPTNDIPVHEVPKLLDWFYPWMEQELDPLIKAQFRVTDHQHQRFYVHDAFFVRYIGDKETNHLPPHFDECSHSLLICLNDDFQGGGTYFHSYNTVLSPKVGEVITFKGDSLKHGGDAVTSGTRYILAVFLYLDKRCSVATSASLPQLNKRHIQNMFQEPKKQKTGFSFGFEV